MGNRLIGTLPEDRWDDASAQAAHEAYFPVLIAGFGPVPEGATLHFLWARYGDSAFPCIALAIERDSPEIVAWWERAQDFMFQIP